MTGWEVALTIGAVAVLIVSFILFVRRCRANHEPNMPADWRDE